MCSASVSEPAPELEDHHARRRVRDEHRQQAVAARRRLGGEPRAGRRQVAEAPVASRPDVDLDRLHGGPPRAGGWAPPFSPELRRRAPHRARAAHRRRWELPRPPDDAQTWRARPSRPRTVESSVDDSDLVTRAQHGDVEAFAALTRARARRLFSVARMIVRDDELAADVVQDALLRAWIDLQGAAGPDRFDAWLRRILVRACYGAARRAAPAGVVEITLAPDWEPPSIGADDDSPSAVALRDQLERAFGRLSPEQRATVVLHFYLGLTLDEAADDARASPPGRCARGSTGRSRRCARPSRPTTARPFARRGDSSNDRVDRSVRSHAERGWLELARGRRARPGSTSVGRRGGPDYAPACDVAGAGRPRGRAGRRGPACSATGDPRRWRWPRRARGRRSRSASSPGGSRPAPPDVAPSVAPVAPGPSAAPARTGRSSTGAWATVDGPGIPPSGLVTADAYCRQ